MKTRTTSSSSDARASGFKYQYFRKNQPAMPFQPATLSS